jgi:NADH-quinone oxidoreductase subunit C
MPTPQEIAELLKSQCPGAVVAESLDGRHPSVTIAAEAWPKAARFLRDDSRTALNSLRLISALDLHPEPFIEVVYELIAMKPASGAAVWQSGGEFAVRIRAPRDGGSIPTVSDVWPTADWHEREAFDLLGVGFEGHPDLRRILCPDDWIGHPLRKDYVMPTEYNGIPAAAAEAVEGGQ